jgi:hypothetical protein
MTTPTEDEARAAEPLASTLDDAYQEWQWAPERNNQTFGEFATVYLARRQVVTTPEWEYATVSEVTSAQVINAAHVGYWRSRGFQIIRRRKAGEWEPVPTEGEA